MSIVPSLYFLFYFFIFFLTLFSSSLSPHPYLHSQRTHTYFSSSLSPRHPYLLRQPMENGRTPALFVFLAGFLRILICDLPHIRLVLAFARRIHRGGARPRSCSDGASPLRPVLACSPAQLAVVSSKGPPRGARKKKAGASMTKYTMGPRSPNMEPIGAAFFWLHLPKPRCESAIHGRSARGSLSSTRLVIGARKRLQELPWQPYQTAPLSSVKV